MRNPKEPPNISLTLTLTHTKEKSNHFLQRIRLQMKQNEWQFIFRRTQSRLPPTARSAWNPYYCPFADI